MAIMGKDGVELRLPTPLDRPDRLGEAMPTRNFRVPDHMDLPDSDGEIVENFQELPQVVLLESVRPILDRLHPDRQYAIGGNSGIYWDLTDPPLRGAIAPDWYYVPGVPPLRIGGQNRRSYVMWKELIPPRIVMEFSSGDGTKERDRTPRSGKFWVYENGVKAEYYVIFDAFPLPGRVEVFRLVGQRYEPRPANPRGRFEFPELGVELGLWHGVFHGMNLPWIRFWGPDGTMLPSSEDLEKSHESATRRAEEERLRADQQARLAGEERLRADQQARLAGEERLRADQQARLAGEERLRAEALAARLRALGIDPDEVAGSA